MQEIGEQAQRVTSIEWMIIPFFFVLISYAIIRHLKVGIIGASFQQYLSFGLASKSYRDAGSQSTRLITALILNSFITLSILIYKIIFPLILFDKLALYFIILACVVVLFFIKKLIIYFVENITEASGILNKVQVYTRQFYQIIGVLLLPGIIAILFFPEKTDVKFFHFLDKGVNIGYVYSIFIFSILYLFRLFQSFRQSFEVKISWSYIILYLCTLEILPLVVIYRLLVGEIWMFN